MMCASLVVRAVLFPPCTMLEVRRAAPPDHETMTLHEVVKAATSPTVLHKRLETRRSSNMHTSRFRVENDCDEDGKSFISIEVLPHFL